MSTPEQILNGGDLNHIASVAKAVGLGTLLAAGGYRLVGETVAVATASATPTYNCKKLLYARTIGTGAPAEKATTGIAGAAPGAGFAAPATGGATITFNAETTGTGTAELIYLTTDPADVGGAAKTALTADLPGYTV